jgi:hypothetical protein
LALERRGLPVLHASALLRNGGAVAFIGPRGSGKSSLAVHLLEAGLELISDDTLPVAAAGAQPLALPSYPSVRLWEQRLPAMLRGMRFPRIHPTIPKVRVPVGTAGFGTFAKSPAPLELVYVLEPLAVGAPRRPSFENVDPASALAELVRHSAVGHLIAGTSVEADRLATLARVASAVSMRRVHYDRRAVERLATAVMDDMQRATG